MSFIRRKANLYKMSKNTSIDGKGNRWCERKSKMNGHARKSKHEHEHARRSKHARRSEHTRRSEHARKSKHARRSKHARKGKHARRSKEIVAVGAREDLTIFSPHWLPAWGAGDADLTPLRVCRNVKRGMY
jgi:hypothetical protein